MTTIESNYDEIDSNYDEETLDDMDIESLGQDLADMDISDEDFLKLGRMFKRKKKRKNPSRKQELLAKLRGTLPGSDLPLELRGERIARGFHRNASILGDTGLGTARVYAIGATPLVYLNKFADYQALRQVLIANTQGAAVKTFASGLKAAAANLSVTCAQNAWGYVVKLATPFASARFTGVTIAITLTGPGTTLSVRVDPIVKPGRWPVMMEFAILSASANAGIGQPALSTACNAVITDLDPGVVDGATTLQIESLNLRDLGINRPCQ